MALGEKLKKAREEKGLTLKDIQENIKIRTRYLKAIEEENFDIIPGQAYVKAFIKSYASHLGLNTEELITEYEQKLEEERLKIDAMETEKETKGFDLLHNKVIFSTLIIIIVIILVAFIIYNISLLNNSQNEISSFEYSNYSLQQSEAEIEGGDAENLNSTKQLETGNEEELTANEVEEKELKIIASERSWIQVFVDGEEKFEGIMEAGERKIFTGDKNLQIKIGNASGITIEKEGKIIGPWGKRGEVVTKEIEF